MTVKSFGCSFTWGSELPDEVLDPVSCSSRLTWPALLANHLGHDYQCFAWPGVGNFYIANNVLTRCATASSDDLFIINWTFIDRFDYLPAQNDSVQNLVLPTKWKTCRPGNDSDFFKKYHSEVRDKLQSLQLIKLCIDTLLQLKIPFIMTAIDDLILDRRWNISPSITLLQDYVQPHITKFNDQTLIQYADSRGHSRCPEGHLNQHAHSDIAQYVINLLDTQSIADC